MRKAKRLAASLLVGAMLTGAMSMVSLADWRLEDGSWYFYNSEGEMRTDYFRTDKNGKTYFLGSDGVMVTDQLIPVWFKTDENGTRMRPTDWDSSEMEGFVYARPNGEIVKSNWVRLEGSREEAGRAANEDMADWYYFGADMLAVQGQVTEIGKEGVFSFDEEGRMHRDVWLASDSDAEPGEGHYYTYFGNRAQSGGNGKLKKFLNIDGQWYQFGADGTAEEYEITGSEESDVLKNLATVEEIWLHEINDEDPEGESDFTLEVGAGSLVFEVQLASSSDAQRTLNLSEAYHDVYLARNLDVDGGNENQGMLARGVSAKITSVKTNDKGKHRVKVNYEAKAPGSFTLELTIDGVRIPVTIHSVLPSGGDALVQAVGDMTDTVLGSTGSGHEEDCADALAGQYNQNSSARQVGSEEAGQIVKQTIADKFLNQKTDVANLEGSYVMIKGIEVTEDVTDEAGAKLQDSTFSVTGAALSMEDSGTMEFHIDTAEDLEVEGDYEKKASFDISAEANGEEKSEFRLPFVVEMSLPVGFDTTGLKIFHSHNGGEPVEITSFKISGTTVSFTVDQLSTFMFVQADDSDAAGTVPTPDSSYDSSDDDDWDDSGSSSADTEKQLVTVDMKKGKIHAVKGIITGEGSGYSKWVAERRADGSMGWKLYYADGTVAAGTLVTREDGSSYVQPLWELINGAWFAFDADGYANAGWIYDTALGGWFYVNIDIGMLTDWQWIGGKWYYLQTVSDGRRGMMYANRWIDGWYVGADGAWDGKAQQK